MAILFPIANLFAKEIKEEVKEVEVAENIFGGPLDKSEKEKTKEGLKLRIGGLAQFDTITGSQDSSHNNVDSSRPHLGIGNTNLKFMADYKAKDNLKFGYLIRLSPQVNKNNVVDRNYIYIDKKGLGLFELGNVKGPHDGMFKYAQRLIGGANGWDGSLSRVYRDALGAFDAIDPVGHTGTATKAVFYTPEFKINCASTFQFGIGFVPNTNHFAGSEKNNWDGNEEFNKPGNGNPNGIWLDKKKSPHGDGHIDFAARFEHCLSKNTKCGLAALYMTDSASSVNSDKPFKARGTNAWGVSALFKHKQFGFGIEYMNCGRSRLPVDETFGQDLLDKKVTDTGSIAQTQDAYTTSKTAADVAAAASAPNALSLASDAATAKGKMKSAYEGILHLPGASKGHAGHSITTTLQYKMDEKNTFALGYQWTRAKLTDVANTRRNTYTITYDRKIREGLGFYVEIDLINSKLNDPNGLVVDNLTKINTGQEAKDKKIHGSNNGAMFILGLRVQI